MGNCGGFAECQSGLFCRQKARLQLGDQRCRNLFDDIQVGRIEILFDERPSKVSLCSRLSSSSLGSRQCGAIFARVAPVFASAASFHESFINLIISRRLRGSGKTSAPRSIANRAPGFVVLQFSHMF